ncbi:MAG: GTP-binding protein, partial [Ruminococcaceae bacterium]|nr:GTP-binding protein [Oscillospiraceae bacterium]
HHEHHHEHEHHHHHHGEEECHDPECSCHHHHDEDEHEHHHHHDGEECHDPECSCHHHHDEDEHEHHHHHHDGEECHDPECSCHHHHHHADEVFTALGAETEKCFAEEEIKNILEAIAENTEAYGMILRAKGILPTPDGKWIHFDYVPGEGDVRFGSAAVTGRLCVIGSNVKKEALETLFGVSLKG